MSSAQLVWALTNDPELPSAFYAAMATPLPERWPLFDGYAGLALALIGGTALNGLCCGTADAMRDRRPDMLFAELQPRRHIPFLDEPEAVEVLTRQMGPAESYAADRPTHQA